MIRSLRYVAGTVLIAALLILAACAPAAAPAAPTQAPAAQPTAAAPAPAAPVQAPTAAAKPAAKGPDKISLGAVIPLTGAAAEVGNEEKNGIDYAVKDVNANGGILGSKLEVVYEDNQAKPDQSVVSFNKLIDVNKVPVVMTGYSGPTLAMAPLATRTKTALVNGGAQSDALATASPYLFNTVPVLKGEIEVLAKYVYNDLGKKTAAIIYQHDASGDPGKEDFEAAFTALGGKILTSEPVAFGETNFRAPLAKVATAKPEVLFAIMTQNYTQLCEQKNQMKLDVVMVSNTWVNQPSTIASPDANGFYHTQFVINAPQDLTARYKAERNVEMAFYAKQYYNAMLVVERSLQDAIEKGKPINGDSVKDAILSIKRFDGLGGPMIFNGNTAVMNLDINQIRNGKDEFVKTIKAE